VTAGPQSRAPWQTILGAIAAEAGKASPRLRAALLRLTDDVLRAERAHGEAVSQDEAPACRPGAGPR
jgi:hypothetical protein